MTTDPGAILAFTAKDGWHLIASVRVEGAVTALRRKPPVRAPGCAACADTAIRMRHALNAAERARSRDADVTPYLEDIRKLKQDRTDCNHERTWPA